MVDVQLDDRARHYRLGNSIQCASRRHGGWQTLVGKVTYNGATAQATSNGHLVYGSQSWNHLFDDGFQFNSDLTNWSAKVTTTAISMSALRLPWCTI